VQVPDYVGGMNLGDVVAAGLVNTMAQAASSTVAAPGVVRNQGLVTGRRVAPAATGGDGSSHVRPGGRQAVTS